MKISTPLFSVVSFCLLLPVVTRGQVAPMGSGNQVVKANSLAITIPAGVNRLLIVTASDALATNIISVNLDGTPLAERREQNDGFAVDAFYTLVLGTSATPTSGTLFVTSNISSTTGKFISAQVFQYVDQTTPLASLQSRAGSGVTSSSFTMTAATNDLVIDLFDTFNEVSSGTRTPGAGQTNIHNSGSVSIGGGFAFYGVSTKPGAAPTTTTSWTTTHSNLIHLAATIKFGGGALPITVMSFNAVRQGEKVQLQWTTEDAMDFSHFDLERSTDGATFSAVAQLLYAPLLSGHYQYEDKDGGLGTRLYYRLKLVDLDGSYVYSRTLAVFPPGSSTALRLQPRPNPFTNRLLVDVYLDSSESIELTVTDLGGRPLLRERRDVPKGFSSLEISNADQLSKGIYIVTLQAGGQSVTQQVIKQ